MVGVCNQEGFHDKTVRFYRSALYARKVLLKDPLQTSVILWNLHTVYEKLGKRKQSLLALSEAVEIRQKPGVLPLPKSTGTNEEMEKDHNFTVHCALTAVKTYEEVNQLQKSIKYYEIAINIQRTLFGDSIYTATAMITIGSLYFKVNNNLEAIKFSTRHLRCT